MKKRGAALVFVAFLCAMMITACGSGGSGGGESTGPAGETFDTGKFSVLVPTGWKAFETPDMWSDEEGAIDDTSLAVYKGAEKEIDMLLKCGMNFKYFESETNYFDSRELYDEASDISPIKTGDLTWEGFHATMEITEDSAYHYTVLTTKKENGALMQVTILEENEGETISADDADVRAILESVTFN